MIHLSAGIFFWTKRLFNSIFSNKKRWRQHLMWNLFSAAPVLFLLSMIQCLNVIDSITSTLIIINKWLQKKMFWLKHLLFANLHLLFILLICLSSCFMIVLLVHVRRKRLFIGCSLKMKVSQDTNVILTIDVVSRNSWSILYVF